MPTVFEAAETGNIEALKELKKEGETFNKKDSNGNTPLLKASCNGHLETVKWLLLDGGAQITEKNKAGNTALLLAATFGHLDLVILLLSQEGGAEISETNMLGNTSILMAAYHGQISVVDYLIRYFYTSLEFNDAEKKEFNFFSKNVAIHHYLEVFKLFSQETVNFAELTSLLSKVTQHLKSDELSFIYLICFWMLIKCKANMPSNCSEILAIESCRQKLLPSHQSELISYMFKEGYVLDNCFINQDTLVITGLSLDEGQINKIEQLLKQHENDHYLMSRNSIVEKKELYTSYYLMPVYRSLMHAYALSASSSGLHAVESALNDPYTYYLNTTQETILEDDIAKWTAYHLCQRADTTPKQHRDAYARTIGTSRIAYYEAVKKYLNDNDVQKKPLLLQLGDMAASDGERLHWVKEYPLWLQDIGHALDSQVKTQSMLTLIGLTSPLSLRDIFSQQLWDSQKHEPKPSILPGNHPVYKLALNEQQAIYCKLYPGLPGINDALHYLYRRVFSSVGGLPWSTTGLLKIDNQTIPVLLSEDAGSPIDANDERLEKLDQYTRSKLILFTILTNTEDGKRENHALQKNARGFYDIYSVDNDQGLVEATTDTYDWLIHKTKKLSVKSLLFCLDAMNDPLDETAVQEFLTLNPIDTLKAWLKDLSQLEEQYALLFNEFKEKSATEKNLLRRSYLQIVLPVATLLRIAYKLELLQKTLKSGPEISPLKLLHTVEPIVANYYGSVLQKPLSATARFDELVKNEGLYRYSEKTKSYSTTITSSRAVFESLVPDNLPDAVTPSLALEIFEEIAPQWEKLKLDQVRVMQGEIDSFSRLPLKEEEKVLKLTRLNQLSSLQRLMLLQALCKRTDFTELHLCYPEASLTSGGFTFSSFEWLLYNNTGLECLSITHATSLTAVPLLNNLKSLKKLELIQLPKVKEISATLPILTDLVIKANSQLTTLTLDAPQLRRLRIIDCQNLKTLNLPKSMALEDVIIQGCNLIPLADFYSIWPGFISRWHEVPSGFCQRLADYITQSFGEASYESREVVYDTVTYYQEQLNQLCQWTQGTPDQIHIMACVLAHLGYDHPRVISTLLGSCHESDQNLAAYKTTLIALKALQIKDERVIQFLIKTLKSDRFVFNHTITSLVAEALGALQVRDDSIILGLIQNLKDTVRLKNIKPSRDWYSKLSNDSLSWGFMRCKALIEALMALQIKNEYILDELEQIFKEESFDEYKRPYVYRNFTYALGRLQISDKRVTQWLLHMFKSGYSTVRETAAKSVQALQIKDKRIIKFLAKGLFDTAPGAAVACASSCALISLGVVENEDFISLLLMKLDSIRSHDWRNANAIAYLKINDTRIIQRLSEIVILGKAPNFLSIGITGINATVWINRPRPESNYAEIINPLASRIRGLQLKISSNEEDFCSYTKLIFGDFYGLPQTAFQALFLELIKKDGNIKESGYEDIPLSPELDSPIPGIPAENIEKNKSIEKKTDNKGNNKRILLAAGQGDLSIIKELLSKKNGEKQIAEKDALGDTALSLAANNGHFLVVDYLIRYHYVESIFNANEKKALNSLSKNNMFRYYLDVFKLFSKSPPDYKKIKLVLNEATQQLHADELSIIYLLYFWMHVYHQAKKPLSEAELMNDEPAVYQLLSEHQSELILHMIQQGYVLKNWYISSNELSITNMTLDKKQVNALEQLLEQSEYRFCLKLPNSVIENNRIYLELNEQGALQYTVRDFNGKIRVGLISCGELGCELTVPLTLDQLKSLPDLLEHISNSGYLRPKFQTLNFNNVRFTKEYRIRTIPLDCIIEKNTLYVQTTNDCIEYTVITPSGKKITDIISGDMLRKKGVKFEFQAASIIFPPRFKQILSGILEITTERGHTTAENTTKGYKEFLKLLKNPVLITKLHSLYLQSCDLFDGYDLDALYPVLAQRTALRYLNLDNNHVTRQGLLKLLEVFKTAEPQSRLETLSLCFNKIQIDSLKKLDELTLKAMGLTALHLEGNIIVEDPKEDDIFKKEHRKRKYALGKLLPLLAEKEPGLTIDSFISATHISLSEEEHHLRLKLNDANGNEREIEITLDAQDFDFYDQLRMNEIDKTERDYSEILPYIKAGINPTNTPKWLRNLPLPHKGASIVEQKEVSKQLLNYHRDALLKGRLTRHSFFRSEKIAEQPSMLFPETRLTLEEGRVYLIANDKGLGGEHVRLAYEYITGYGQRIFRIAHLFQNKEKFPVVAFDDHNLEKCIPWLLREHLIATFSATTKNIKALHLAIKKDVALGINLPIYYFPVISGSSKNKSVMNCLTYCLIKMEESLKNIIIPMGLTDFLPSTVVKNCIEVESAIESETLGLIS